MAANIVPVIVAASIARARRRVIAHFDASGADRADAAVTFEPASRMERKQFERLCHHGAIVEAGGGRYYLRRDALAKAEAARVRRMIAIMCGLLAVVLGVVVATGALSG